jgi:hypothetical protein
MHLNDSSLQQGVKVTRESTHNKQAVNHLEWDEGHDDANK